MLKLTLFTVLSLPLTLCFTFSVENLISKFTTDGIGHAGGPAYLYKPSSLEVSINMAILVISVVGSFFLLTNFLFIKSLKSVSGQILVLLSFSEIMCATNRLIIAITCPTNRQLQRLQYNSFSHYIDLGTENLVSFYNLSLCTYYLSVIKNPLKGCQLPILFYKVFPVILAICAEYFLNFAGHLINTYPELYKLRLFFEISESVIKCMFYVAVTLYCRHSIKIYLDGLQEKISNENDMEFNKYFRNYLFVMMHIYIGRGVIEIVNIIIMNRPMRLDTKRTLDAIMSFLYIMTQIMSLILIYARFQDPLLLAYWKKFFSQLRSINQETNDISTKVENAETERKMKEDNKLWKWLLQALGHNNRKAIESFDHIKNVTKRFYTHTNEPAIHQEESKIGAQIRSLNGKSVRRSLKGLTGKSFVKNMQANDGKQDQAENFSDEGSNTSTQEESGRKSNLSMKILKIAVESQPKIYQVQHERKKQLLYSILSGIHYFFHLKKTHKLDNYAVESGIHSIEPVTVDDNTSKLKDHIREKMEAKLRKKYRTKQTINLKKTALKNEIPDIYKGVKAQGFGLAQGRLKIYAPEAFEEIMALDGVKGAIVDSLDLEENIMRIELSGLNSAGKSGEFFFFSKDNKLILKTMSRKEFRIMLKILPFYIRHLKENPNSLLAKIYGVFAFKVRLASSKHYFMLMRNINEEACTAVMRKYDLKGSTVGRRSVKNTDVSIDDLKRFHILKDLDFKKYERIDVDKEHRESLLKALKADTDFLESMGLIDYSLVFYVIDKEKSKKNFSDETLSENYKENPLSIIHAEINGEDVENKDLKISKVYYQFGIIDYLTEFGLKKKLEIFFKKLFALNPNCNISAQPPNIYASRFLKFLESNISKDQDVESEDTLKKN